VYHYYEKDEEAIGYRMVSVELYEGEKADDKTKRCEFSLLFFLVLLLSFGSCSSDMTPYSKESMNVTAIEQSYVFPHGITAFTTTSTKFWITSKDFVGTFTHLRRILKTRFRLRCLIKVANKNGQIQSYSRTRKDLIGS
jgi:ER membrane protein complex subunit 1, C-terminal